MFTLISSIMVDIVFLCMLGLWFLTVTNSVDANAFTILLAIGVFYKDNWILINIL